MKIKYIENPNIEKGIIIVMMHPDDFKMYATVRSNEIRLFKADEEINLNKLKTK